MAGGVFCFGCFLPGVPVISPNVFIFAENQKNDDF